MIANYHTHTPRCLHAVGTEREYIERAIEGGIRILGFSDHSPYPFPAGWNTDMRMKMRQMEGYVTTLLDLKKEYAKDIELHIGVEAEYHAEYWEELLRFFEDYPLEYMILGQHFLNEDLGKKVFSSMATTDARRLHTYVDECITAIKTGRFVYIAHPDLLNFQGEPDVYDREYRRLCREAKACGIPLEINFLGLTEGRHYPNPSFWKIAGEEGNDVVFGCDAHHPKMVWNPEGEKTAQEWVERYGLHLLTEIELKREGNGR